MRIMRLRPEPEPDVDFIAGASASLKKSIARIAYRQKWGRWLEDPLMSPTRRELQRAIDSLISTEIERYKRGEYPEPPSSGPQLRYWRRGAWHSRPL